MIRKVRFSNFYSFYKEQEINFLAQKKETYDYYNSESGDQITKVAGFIGGNASGKTNVMRLFSFISLFVCQGIKDTTILSVYDSEYKTFFNNNEISTFYVEFEIEKSVLFYSFKIQNDFILNESLSIREIKNYARKIEIFSREKNIIKNLNSEYFKNIQISSLPEIKKNFSFISFIKELPYNVQIMNDIYNYFENFETNTGELNIQKMSNISRKISQNRAINNYFKDDTFKNKVDNFVNNSDIGLSGFEIKDKNQDNSLPIRIQGIHTTKSKNNKLELKYESRGTLSLFFSIANILESLEKSSVLIIDEIETGLHPEAVDKLISYFIDENKDTKAQIIFSSHSLGFMNKLDMHQIYLTEKDQYGESSIKRLNQVEGIRSDENFLSKYMTGVYGAFPKIRV